VKSSEASGSKDVRAGGAKSEAVAWRRPAASKVAPVAPMRAVSPESCSEKMTIAGTQIQAEAQVSAKSHKGRGATFRKGLDGFFQ
jgi:hypothetical protein